MIFFDFFFSGICHCSAPSAVYHWIRAKQIFYGITKDTLTSTPFNGPMQNKVRIFDKNAFFKSTDKRTKILHKKYEQVEKRDLCEWCASPQYVYLFPTHRKFGLSTGKALAAA